MVWYTNGTDTSIFEWNKNSIHTSIFEWNKNGADTNIFLTYYFQDTRYNYVRARSSYFKGTPLRSF